MSLDALCRFMSFRTLIIGSTLLLAGASCGINEARPLPPAVSATAGCTKDTDCRVARICREGKCIPPNLGGSDGGSYSDGGVPNYCYPHSKTICHQGDVYWQDSCGNLENLAQECTPQQDCRQGECKDICFDRDVDGFYAGAECPQNTDCNDLDNTINPQTPEYCDRIDNNCNSMTDENCGCVYLETQPCGSNIGQCRPGTKTCTLMGMWNECLGAIMPVIESCDGLDNDCDGMTDEGLLRLKYRDNDADGYGMGEAGLICPGTTGYSERSGDCNDMNQFVYPDTAEICNGVDDDCDGMTDEGVLTTFYRDGDMDTFGAPLMSRQACMAPTGFVNNGRDCNDSNTGINPNAMELCDMVDNDCDGMTDEGFNVEQTCSTGIGGCTRSGVYVCTGDRRNSACNASAGSPGMEICNDRDDDCDGRTDEGSACGRIVFSSNRGGGNLELFIMDADGSEVRGLTDMSGFDNQSPRWGPDRRTVLFRSIIWYAHFLRVIADDQSNLRTVAATDSHQMEAESWYPTGTAIAYSTVLEGLRNIYTVPVAVHEEMALTSDGVSSSPDVSPDGTRIAFLRGRDYRVYVMNAIDGSAQTMLTYTTSSCPRWSPDGTRIAFIREENIYTMRSDGTDQQPIPNTNPAQTCFSWSPNGRKMVFSTNREIRIVNSDGTDLTTITSEDSGNIFTRNIDPDWAPLP